MDRKYVTLLQLLQLKWKLNIESYVGDQVWPAK